MDLCSALASPRLCQLDGETYWIRPLKLGDYALILAWLDDVLPGKTERTIPPLLCSEESQKALSGPLGWHLLIWLGLRDQGVTWNEAYAIALEVADHERVVFRNAIYARRRTFQPGMTGQDLGAVWAGPIFAGTHESEGMCQRLGMTLEEIANLTLDQIDCLQALGCPEEDPRRVTHEELARFDALAKLNREAKERKPDEPTGFEVAIDEAIARFEAAKAEEQTK